MALCGGIISERTIADAEFPNGPQLKSALLDAEYQVHTYLYIRHTLELVATLGKATFHALLYAASASRPTCPHALFDYIF